MKSFWLPSQSPDGLLERVEKPSKLTKNPFGDLLSVKELVTLNLKYESPTSKERFICPVCLKSLNSVSGVLALKNNGSVFCKPCYDTILKIDKIDPVSNTPFAADDVFELESEGTSFASRTGERSAARKTDTAPRFG